MTAMQSSHIGRRNLLRAAAASVGGLLSPLALPGRAAAKPPSIPIGLEMYSLKDDERQDMLGTLRAVKAMGYDGVEFWAPYLDWSRERVLDIRQQLDDTGLRCFSTHNRFYYFRPDRLDRVVDYNLILGSRYVVMANTGPIDASAPDDSWNRVADRLTAAHARVRAAGLRAGFHNQGEEWKASLAGGKRPIDLLVARTPRDIGFQLDTATCLAAGADPVAFIRANPGRVRSYHLKDWSNDPAKGYKVLLGEGIGDWRALALAAEGRGGVEYYLIEQEGSRLPPMETARTCLQNFRALSRSAG
jgi:sugar phosphate isomerase/epimerase